jgi:DNA invertase Pin-like site-specific DNA recombinase
VKDARHRQFDVVLVWASDRIARSVRHFLEVLDELNHLGIDNEARRALHARLDPGSAPGDSTL